MTTSTTGPTVRVGDIVHYKGRAECRAAVVTGIAPSLIALTTLSLTVFAPASQFNILIDLTAGYDSWHLLDECRG